VTDLAVNKRNIAEMVQAARARWKIENETFNTLKNQGYHIEHNFGHGKKNLSMNFFTLNLLAFFIHQILDLCDPIYQRCRTKFSSRKEYWNQLRCTFRVLCFNNWEHMLNFIWNPPEISPPLIKKTLELPESIIIIGQFGQERWSTSECTPSEPHPMFRITIS